jgi:hypothetical protein
MENNHRIRMAGTLYTVGGALWLCWILGWTLLTGEIPGTGSSFFYLSQIGFILIQTLLFIGFLGIWWSQGVGSGIFGKIAFGLGWLGHFFFILAELFSLGTGSEELLPVAALTTTLGFILTGIAVLRTQRWHGCGRLMPLLTGLYPLVGMFPFLIIFNEPSYIGIGFWGLFRLFLGLAMREQAGLLVVDKLGGASRVHGAEAV